LEKYSHLGICNSNSNIPADPKVQLSKAAKSTTFPYAEVVGSLIWLVKTRPKIAYAVSTCARHLAMHDETHDKAARKILGYLKKYPNQGLAILLTPI
jgi:hypothetical protein